MSFFLQSRPVATSKTVDSIGVYNRDSKPPRLDLKRPTGPVDIRPKMGLTGHPEHTARNRVRVYVERESKTDDFTRCAAVLSSRLGMLRTVETMRARVYIYMYIYVGFTHGATVRRTCIIIQTLFPRRRRRIFPLHPSPRRLIITTVYRVTVKLVAVDVNEVVYEVYAVKRYRPRVDVVVL